MVLAWNYVGGWKNVKESVLASIVQSLLGGGGSFSAGGPGKGMYTRLYRNVLAKYPSVQHCVAYSSIYSDTGLMGVHATCDQAKAAEVVNLMGEQMTSLATTVTSEELDRAKKATMANVLMNLENKNVLVDDMGRQVMTFGHKKPIDEFFKVLKDVTEADISKFVKALLKTKPTFASMGELQNVPRYSAIETKFAAS